MVEPFERLAIVHRGEAATRLVDAVAELNDEIGIGIRAIALYTEPDRHALFVRRADEAVSIGTPTFLDPATGGPLPAYVDPVRLEEALLEARADAAWPGWGYVAEAPWFAALCERLGVTFIGPSAAVLAELADPDRLAARAGAAGVHLWRGDLGGPRRLHLVEVPVAADVFGAMWTLGVRDRTVQRGGFRVLVESACPSLRPGCGDDLQTAARAILDESGFVGVGSVAFAVDADSAEWWLHGVRPRLQVGHGVTEATTGLDLVKLQLHLARGGPLRGEPPAPRGHAATVRISAIDPVGGFVPAPGRLSYLRTPAGPGVRVDPGAGLGDLVPADLDDPLVASVVAFGRDRVEALARLHRALADTAVILDGGTTDKAFLLEVLDQPGVRDGHVDIGFLDRMTASGELRSRHHAGVALVLAAVEAAESDRTLDQQRFLATAARGRPEVTHTEGRTVELRSGPNRYRLVVSQLGPGRYVVATDRDSIEVEIDRLGAYERRVTTAGRTWRTISVVRGAEHDVEVEGVPHRFRRDDGGIVRAPSPAVVVSVPVATGDEVAAGDTVAVIETMKMELTVPAPSAGRVRAVLTRPNEQVEAGGALVQLDPLHVHTADEGGPISLPEGAGPSPDAATRMSEELRALVLGYDVADGRAQALPGEYRSTATSLPAADPALLDLETALLDAFADIGAISRRQPDVDVEVDEHARSAQEHLYAFLRSPERARETLPASFLERLGVALRRYGVHTLDRSPALEEACYWLFRAQSRVDEQVPVIAAILTRWLDQSDVLGPGASEEQRALLDRLVQTSEGRNPVVGDLAREVRYHWIDLPVLEATRQEVEAGLRRSLDDLVGDPGSPDRPGWLDALVDSPYPMHGFLLRWGAGKDRAARGLEVEVLARRYYRIRDLTGFAVAERSDFPVVSASYEFDGRHIRLLATAGSYADLPGALAALRGSVMPDDPGREWVLDLYLDGEPPEPVDSLVEALIEAADAAGFAEPVRRIVVSVTTLGRGPAQDVTHHITLRRGTDGYREDGLYRDLHPMLAKRLDLRRLDRFDLDRLPSQEGVYLFHARAFDQPRDERIFAVAEVRDLTAARDDAGHLLAVPEFERVLAACLADLRRALAPLPTHKRPVWNRVILHARPPWEFTPGESREVARRLAPATRGLGLELVQIPIRVPDGSGGFRSRELVLSSPNARDVVLHEREMDTEPVEPLTPYRQKVALMRRRGLVYPYELVRLIAPGPDEAATTGFPPGRFVELDLDEEQRLVPVDRPPGENTANVIVGLISNVTEKHPEGMERVALFGDPSRSLGSLAEDECRRINAALDLAEERGLPVEWYALSSGARISMQSGTENMDWIGAVLRRLIEFTQAGREVNVVVCGINVGAQPYWNAEATMLMHTRGILVMIPESAMVLTGKMALDFSGGTSAEDNLGIGGYERVMGPNGQAQYWAPDLEGAARLLLHHYEHTYVAPGERFPRRAATSDPYDRDVRDEPLRPVEGGDLARVGDIFSDDTNPERKKPFDIRSVMRAVMDSDRAPLERWARMAEAESVVVWDAHVGGIPVCLIGMESHPIAREGFVRPDGPRFWTAGTLFPRSSKKTARAINAASGNRPVVVLANLSGFDGSPESMRNLQLEFGAEIGRAVTNFRGPMVMVVVSRYHGGAFVVFSKALNERLEIAAVEGSYASVIGGAPAAAVVFAAEVDKRTQADPRVAELRDRLATASGTEAAALRREIAGLTPLVRLEKLGEVADEYDHIHDINRALRMGSVDHIIAGGQIRPYLVDALERGMALG